MFSIGNEYQHSAAACKDELATLNGRRKPRRFGLSRHAGFEPYPGIRAGMRMFGITIISIGEPLIERNSVQQNLGLVAAGSADENGSQLARNSGLHDINARYRLERVGDEPILVLLDIRIRYDADGGGGTIFRGREASSGHRERFELLGRSRRGSLSESRRESNAVPAAIDKTDRLAITGHFRCSESDLVG